MVNDTGEQTVEERLQAYDKAVRLLFDWCGYRYDDPNTVIAMGVRDIIDGKPHSEKAIQAGVLARQRASQRLFKVDS